MLWAQLRPSLLLPSLLAAAPQLRRAQPIPKIALMWSMLGMRTTLFFVLLVDLQEQETVRKTFRGITDHIDDAIRAFPDLQSVVLTIHPRDRPETEEDESLGESITHMFWDFDNAKTVAREIGIPERRLHPFRMMNNVTGHSRVSKVIDFVDERNMDTESVSFLRMLFEKDINEINIERPNWDRTTSYVRAGATFVGVAAGLEMMGIDPKWYEWATIVGVPTIAAWAAGIKNKALAAWEEGRITDDSKKPSRMRSYFRQLKGILKNTVLATGFVASFYIPMSVFGYAPSLLDPGLFLSTAGIALANNVGKKTLIVRSLTRWKHDKYQENPRNAAKYSRFHAWAMAAVGALVTATDVWQVTLPKDEPLYWIISGSMLAGGIVAYKYAAKVERMYNLAAAKCGDLFIKNRE